MKMNIYHRKDGRWEGRIPKEQKKGEKKSFHYFLGRTRELVLTRMERFRYGNFSQTCDILLKDIYADWIQGMRCRIKASTYANYQLKWNKHICPKFGNFAVSAIRTKEIYAFITEKQQEGLSNRYISDMIVLMKSIFKYAVKQYHIENPLDGIIMPKKKAPEIALFDETEQKKLQNYLSEHSDLSNFGISLAMTTGIRIGELCALQWKDIDLEKRILTVRKTLQRIQIFDQIHRTKLVITEPKSETSKRCIPIPECIMPLLRRFQGKEEEFLCSGKTKPVEPRTMQYRFAKILKNVNLPSVHFHALRHMFASNCVKLGFDIKALSEILGHSNVKITLERYVHPDFSIKQAYMQKIQFD